MRVLFITPGWGGHVLPFVAPAQRLTMAGHDVHWITTAGPPVAFANFGLTGTRLASEHLPSPGPYRPDEQSYWRRYLQAKAAWVPVIRGAIRDLAPDAIALDASYESLIAAHLEAVPYAKIFPSLTPLAPPHFDCPYFQMFRALASERAALFDRFQVAVELHDFHALSPWLNTVFTTRAFVGDDTAVPASTVLVGPSMPQGRRGDEPAFPWDHIDPDRPLIYASFGTTLGASTVLIMALIEAASALGAQLVLASPGLDEPSRTSLSALSPAAIIVPYAPQLALLQRAHVFVTHGGANAIMEAMSCGVPILVLPMAADQPLQGYFAEKAGVGCAIAPSAADRACLLDRLGRLLAPASPCKQAALRVRASYQQADGAGEVARRLVEIAHRR